MNGLNVAMFNMPEIPASVSSLGITLATGIVINKGTDIVTNVLWKQYVKLPFMQEVLKADEYNAEALKENTAEFIERQQYLLQLKDEVDALKKIRHNLKKQ